MKSSFIKRVIAGAFSFALLIGAGSFLTTTAQAQDRDRRWDRNHDNGRDWDRGHDGDRSWIERERARARAREIERQRELARRRALERNRWVYRTPFPRNYPYGGYGGYGDSGRYDGRYNYDVQKGYHDGLDRGQEDARDRRAPNPNNSSHYRSGNAAYRDGFRRGYEVGYRQYAGYRRW